MKKITVMADFGFGAWAWLSDDKDKYVGGNIGDYFGLSHFKISKALEKRFAVWGADFEANAYKPCFDWDRFHQVGLELSHELKKELGEKVQVVYSKPVEDPNYKEGGTTEIIIAPEKREFNPGETVYWYFEGTLLSSKVVEEPGFPGLWLTWKEHGRINLKHFTYKLYRDCGECLAVESKKPKEQSSVWKKPDDAHNCRICPSAHKYTGGKSDGPRELLSEFISELVYKEWSTWGIEAKGTEDAAKNLTDKISEYAKTELNHVLIDAEKLQRCLRMAFDAEYYPEPTWDEFKWSLLHWIAVSDAVKINGKSWVACVLRDKSTEITHQDSEVDKKK
ncbi:MAG: hypothetical protein PHV33_00495 [Elusimicrobiales bacterium]|nr:hypothetical protein [Elusimicrobiales bacterium]